MKKTLIVFLTLLVTVSCFCGCGQNANGQTHKDDELVSQANPQLSSADLKNLKTYLLNPTKDSVKEFEQLESYWEDDEAYNVTPQGFYEAYDIQIFKYDQSCETFLMYENDIYQLGIGFGGYGVTSFAVADLDVNGSNELYFTFSWGSGLHRSCIGFFDFESKEVTEFNYSDQENEIMLGIDNDNNIGIYSSDFQINSSVEIMMKPNTKILDIIFDGKNIVLSTC